MFAVVRRRSLPYGAPGPIRTGDLQLRRLPLYPPELPGRIRSRGRLRPSANLIAPCAATRLRAMRRAESQRICWYAGRDLNPGPLPPQGSALSAELPTHVDSSRTGAATSRGPSVVARPSSPRSAEDRWAEHPGTPGAIRTRDPWLRRPVLYPLSYGRTLFVPLPAAPPAVAPVVIPVGPWRRGRDSNPRWRLLPP